MAVSTNKQNASGVAVGHSAPAGARRGQLRFDAFGLAGIVLALAIWQTLTLVIPPMALPTPAAVFNRAVDDFHVADQLAYYGLPDTGLLGSMLYTAGNVFIAVIVGSARVCTAPRRSSACSVALRVRPPSGGKLAVPPLG